MGNSIVPKGLKIKGQNKLKYVDSTSDRSLIYTPEFIAKEMLDMLPKDIWSDPSITFLNIPCKDGVFLEKIYWRLEEGLRRVIPDIFERNHHIMKNQIFALSPAPQFATNGRVVLYGTYRADHPNAFTTAFNGGEGNIKLLYREIDGKSYSYRAIVQDVTGRHFREVIEEAFGNMKFDVVIGNPPYNGGMDLDFVYGGFKLCSKYTVMITPAKWQTAAEDQRCLSKTVKYGKFREELAPHMSKIAFYPCCKDIFDIYLHDGITYYLLDKNKEYELCEVINRCNDIKQFNGTITRKIKDGETLLNIGQEIIESLGSYKIAKVDGLKTKSGRYHVYVNHMPSGYDWFETKRPRFLLGTVRVIDSKNESDMRSLPGVASYVMGSDDIMECKSFESWINTRFTRFFLVPSISKMGGMVSDYNFRFVPAPPSGKFDHIYTDQELYKAFNLPQKYIDVIEAVIKERKYEAI